MAVRKKQSEMAAFIMIKKQMEVSGMETKEQNIEQMDVVKQLMEILEKQNMREQSQDFMEVVQYVAGMQIQLAAMVDELHGVKEQLADIQAGRHRSAKDSLLETASRLEGKITQLSEKLSEAKDRLLETASQAVRAFKEKGRQEMNKILKKGISGVQKLLDGIREQTVEVLTGYEKTANQIDSIGDELKQIGNSVSNVGRLLVGKGTKEVSDEKPGVALTRAVNKPVKKAIARLEKNLDSIDRMSEKLDKIYSRLEPQKAAEKGTRTSLKEKLAQMQEKAGAQNRQPDMEKKKEKGKEAVI